MELRQQPQTDHDLLLSAWIFLVGSNGDGLLGKFEKFVEEFNDWRKSVDAQLLKTWTQEDHNEYIANEEECGDRREDRRKINTREWILICATIIIPIAAIIAGHFWK